MSYKIYTKVNSADTTRDKDNISYKDIGYKNKMKDAIKLANKYIEDNFVQKDAKVYKINDGNIVYISNDFCSYGETIIIEKIKID